jgi:hypothetical protein
MADGPTVLLPIQILEGESIPEGVPELLANAHVVLLGYHVVPEQTATGQARMSFEDRADAKLEELGETLADAGASVEDRLVFTHDGQTTIDRVSRETEALAILVPNAVADIEEVLVAVRGTVGIDRLGRLVAGLFAETDATLILYHVAEEGETDADASTLLEGFSDRLENEGVDAARITTRIDRGLDPSEAIADADADVDVVVMGESDPSVVTFLFGMRAEQVADRFLGPVLVVQREKPPKEESS